MIFYSKDVTDVGLKLVTVTSILQNY